MISIIVPVYNVSDYIEECLLSISLQTFTDIECIIVDDCGTDDSIIKVKHFIATYKGNICFRIIHHEHNKGLSAARNTGVNESLGNYILFVDSDDWIAPDTCEKLYSYVIGKEEVGIVSSSCLAYEQDGTFRPLSSNYVFEKNRVISPTDYAERMLLFYSPHTAWGKLFRRDILLNNTFREGFNNEDVLFCLDTFPYIEKLCIYTIEIPDVLYFYRMRKNSICHIEGNSFLYDEFVNQEIVMNTCRLVKPRIFDEYRKRFTRRCVLLLDYSVYASCSFHDKYWIIIKKAWMIDNSYAKKILSSLDYRIFILHKYFPILMLLKKNLFERFKLLS